MSRSRGVGKKNPVEDRERRSLGGGGIGGTADRRPGNGEREIIRRFMQRYMGYREGRRRDRGPGGPGKSVHDWPRFPTTE